MRHTASAGIAIVLALGSSLPVWAQHAPARDCQPSGPVGARPFQESDPQVLSAFVGEYQVVAHRTTTGLPQERTVAHLRIAVTDSAHLYFQPILAPTRSPQRQPLTAWVRWGWDTTAVSHGEVWRLRNRSLVSDPGPDCRHCGGATFRLEWVDVDGFGGSWSQGFDGFSLVGADSRSYDSVGGYFCAWRSREGGAAR